MKKLLLATIISGASFCAFAQATWDFESWTGTEPSGWISENELMLLGNPQSAFQETDPTHVHGGTKALKLVSVANSVAGLPNPIGLAAPGRLVSFAPKFGMPFTSRPASVDFWYQYAPTAGDSAEFLIFLRNSSTGDTIGFGHWTKGTTVTGYTSQTVPLTYNPAHLAELPDSMALTFSASKLFNPNYTMCMNCGKLGSILWVDDVTFNGWNGINEHPSSEGVVLYPNPATDHVTIAVDALNDAFAVRAFDVTGKLVATAPLALSNSAINRRSGVINTFDLSTGLYSYSVLDKNGVALRAGKFSVVK
jgi:hypothetical protein